MQVSEIHQMFGFQQRPCWRDCFDSTAKKRAEEKFILKKSFIIFCARALKNTRERVNIQFVRKIENPVKWRNKLKFNGTEFCKLENGKSRLVRSFSWRKVPFNKPFCWNRYFRFSKHESVWVLYYFFYPFDVSDGVKLPDTYTDSRIMSCKSAAIGEIVIFLQN